MPKAPSLKACTDSEFYNGLLPALNPSTYEEYKKIRAVFVPVIVQICKYGSKSVVVYEHPLLGYGVLPTFKSSFVMFDFFNFTEVELKGKEKPKQFIFDVYMYYSPLDILSLFKTRELMTDIDSKLESGRVLRAKDKSNLVKTNLYFKHNINDKDTYEAYIKIHDMKGFTPAGARGLEQTAHSWGVNFTGKDYKKYFDITDIRSAYLNTTEIVLDGMSQHDVLIQYAKEDVPVLWEIQDAVTGKVEEICQNLGYDSKLKLFSTIGNMTNQIGVKALKSQLRLDELEPEISDYELAKLQYPSSAVALLRESWGTGKYLTSVDGGYCKHKRTTDVIIKDLVSDMDLKGAYASAMKAMPYGVGVPCIVSFPEGRELPLWDKLPKKIKENLIDNLWVARISTSEELSFDQDLIFSKIFGAYDFEDLYDDLINDEETDSENTDDSLDIPTGQFQLLRREIINGVLTSDILEVIDNYWKPSEKREFYKKVQVVSLVFYGKDYEVTDLEKFKNEFQMDGKIELKLGKSSISYKDNRKVSWYRCSMGDGWITEMDNVRSEFKKKKKNLTEGTPEYISVDATQNGLKNINNSTYGVSGSKYYQTDIPLGETGKPKIGNIIAAQNITAMVRVAVWCMSKTLNCHELITDGGGYGLNRIWYWNWNYTDDRGCTTYFGSQELYNLCQANNGNEVDKSRKLGVELKPLDGKQWTVINWDSNNNGKGEFCKVTISNGDRTITGSYEKWEELDNIAYEKCRKDFSKLSCIHKIRFESKRLVKGALFQSQANYLFEFFNGDFMGKARGYDLKHNCFSTPYLDQNSMVKTHPFMDLMIEVYKTGKCDPHVLTHFQHLLLAPNEKNKSEKICDSYNQRGFLSGCSTSRSTTPEMISLSQFNWKTRKQYEEWTKESERIKRKTGYKSAGKFALISGKYDESEQTLVNCEYDFKDACKQIQNAIDTDIPASKFFSKFLTSFVTKGATKTVLHPQMKLEKEFNECNDSFYSEQINISEANQNESSSRYLE